MGEKDDELGLGLSLSLGITQNQQQRRRPCLKKLFQSDRIPDTGSLLRVIDVNQAPRVTNCEEEAGVSSPNSTISSLSGKRSERETVGEEDEAERDSCSRGSDDEGGGDGNGNGSRKKLRLSREQSMVLEETFKEHSALNTKQKLALAKQLNLMPRQVEVWFQNRRARTKLKQTEVDCEHLKRCCEHLTRENRRLQKEVLELRALKLSPNLYMNMKPPTTLTMCPSCERVAVSSSSSSSSSAVAAAVSTIPSGCQPVGSNGQLPMPLWLRHGG